MKSFTILFIVLASISFGFAQNNHELPVDSSALLNQQQAELLNTLLKDSRDTFNFQDKKVAFYEGLTGIQTTNDFFKDIQPWLDKGDTPAIMMVRLTQEEKELSGGYDVLVLTWIKIYSDKLKERILQQLSTPSSAKKKRT